MALSSHPELTPRATKEPLQLMQHGKERNDEYAWMKDENWQKVMQNPASLSKKIRMYLEAENTYTKTVLAPIETLKDTIFEEMKARQEPEESSVPQIHDSFAYGHAYRKGDQYGVFKQFTVNTKTRTLSDDPIIILDAEKLATHNSGYFDLGSVTHSNDHKWIVYSVDNSGSESYEIFVKPMVGDARTTGITKSTGNVEWAANSRTIFWVERDENQRPDSVFYRDIFDKNSVAKLVYKETDPGFFVSISESESGAYIEINVHNHTTSETYIIPSDAPETPPYCIRARQDGIEYSLHEHGDFFYMQTNAQGATDFQIMRTPRTNPAFENWEPFIPHQSGTLIVGIETYQNFLVRLVRSNALPRIIIRDMDTQEEHEIAMKETAYSLRLVGGLEYDTPWLRITYSSPTTPTQVFDYNMKSREKVHLKTQSIPSGHTPSDYVTERLMITARDGVDIPVTLLYREGFEKNGRSPLLLYGYGSYGITIPASFRTSILSLVDRGFVYAIAHIRGGQAKGYQWYLDGKLKNKPNTFTDYVDVGRELCDLNYTQAGKVVGHGGSAGGLLVGVALNLDPDLFGGVIAAVPFVDVLNTMSDTSLPLTPPEWPEWGNPIEDAKAYELIESYSPYDNVEQADYPPVLITAGLTDPRVTYWEPAKWAARLRDHQTGKAPILLRTNMEAGHQGESGRYDSLKEIALEYAFAIEVCRGS